MRREMSVLAAAYSDDEEAAGDFEALKEDLPKVGRLMDRSKVIVLATSDAPNEVNVEHIGGGPIGKLVEVGAGRGLKGRLAPGNAMIVGVIDPGIETEAFEALARARGRALVPVEEGDGDDEQTDREAIQAAVGMAMAQVMEQWAHPTASAGGDQVAGRRKPGCFRLIPRALTPRSWSDPGLDAVLPAVGLGAFDRRLQLNRSRASKADVAG